MNKEHGASPEGDRDTHERSQSPLSPPAVGIPSARVRPRGWSERRWKNFKTHNKARYTPSIKQRLYMIYCDGRSLPTVVHDTYEKAMSEAQRLSHFNRGLRYHVLASAQIWSRAASGIETEGHDPAEGHGAKHESAPEGDAQPPPPHHMER